MATNELFGDVGQKSSYDLDIICLEVNSDAALHGGGHLVSEGDKQMRISKKLLGTVLVSGVVLSLGTPAFAEGFPTDPPAPTKCNSGRGNTSPRTPTTDCDPGNSGGRNNGGD